MRRTAIRELLDGFFDGSEQELAALSGGQPASAAAAPPDGCRGIRRLAATPAGGEEARIDTVLL